MSEDERKRIFSNNLNYYMELNNKKQSNLINDLNLNSSTLSNWCNGIMLPRMNKLKLLADYFEIAISDLLEDKKNLNNSQIKSEEYDHFTYLCKLYFDSVMQWSEDKLLSEQDTIILREHTADLLLRYKRILENYSNTKLYWEKTKDSFSNIYKDRKNPLNEKEIKELFLKQELEIDIENLTDWIKALPNWIVRKEGEYLSKTKHNSKMDNK